MAQRVTVTSGTWQNIGTGPAIVQLIGPSGGEVEVMVECAASAPSGNTQDGMVLSGLNPIIKFSLTSTIWANAIQGSAIVNVQPDVAG
jgi:hypothetical protein